MFTPESPASPARPSSAHSTAEAMNLVLRAEQDAVARTAQARQQGQAALEQARQDALTRINGSLVRIAGWQQAHAAALQVRLDALRAQAHGVAAMADPPGAAAVMGAVARLACQLTGGDGDTRDAAP